MLLQDPIIPKPLGPDVLGRLTSPRDLFKGKGVLGWTEIVWLGREKTERRGDEREWRKEREEKEERRETKRRGREEKKGERSEERDRKRGCREKRGGKGRRREGPMRKKRGAGGDQMGSPCSGSPSLVYGHDGGPCCVLLTCTGVGTGGVGCYCRCWGAAPRGRPRRHG